MDLELLGETAIVTGGSRGIRKAIAPELAAEGVDVAIVAREQQALQTAAAELAEQTGRRSLPIAADTASDAAVKSMVDQAAPVGGTPGRDVPWADRWLDAGADNGAAILWGLARTCSTAR